MPRRAQAGKHITQMAYAKAGIITQRWSMWLSANMNCQELGIDTHITPEYVRDEIARDVPFFLPTSTTLRANR